MADLGSLLSSGHIVNVSSFLLHHLICTLIKWVAEQSGVRQVNVVSLQVIADLVQGEFMQLGSKENENERFAHYLKKTFKKTASLLAYSCKAVSLHFQALLVILCLCLAEYIL